FKFLERLRRRSLFRVAMAYLGSAWFVFHGVTVIGETFEPVHHLMHGLAYVLAAGLPVAIAIAWMRDRQAAHAPPAGAAREAALTSSRTRRLDLVIVVLLVLAFIAIAADRFVFHRPTEQSMLALLGVIILLLVFDRLLNRDGAGKKATAAEAASAEPRVAILPFADMSAEKDQDYFCEGIAEEIINALCAVNGLRVASRSASFQVKNRPMDGRELGRLLNVESFLEGSVRK